MAFNLGNDPMETPYRILVTSSATRRSNPSEFTHSRCVRCGEDMETSPSILVTIYAPLPSSVCNPFHLPPQSNPASCNDDDSGITPVSPSCTSHYSSSCSRLSTGIGHLALPNCTSHGSSTCSRLSTSIGNLSSPTCNDPLGSSVICTSSNESSDADPMSDGNSTAPESIYSQCGDSSSNDSLSEAEYRLMPVPETPSHRSGIYEITADTDCHVAVEDVTAPGRDSREIVSLRLNISSSYCYRDTDNLMSECPLSSKVDIGVRELGVYPELLKDAISNSGEKLPGSTGYGHHIPDLNAEAAYQSHLRKLVPCEFCGRTFNPDRVVVHENACVERKRKAANK